MEEKSANQNKIRKGVFLYLLKLFISFILIYIVFKFYISDSSLTEALKNVSLLALGWIIVLDVVQRFAVSWQTFLYFHATGLPLPFGRVLSAQWIASFFAIFLPGDLLSGGVTVYRLNQSSGKAVEITAGLVYLRLILYVTLIPAVIAAIWKQGFLQSPQIIIITGVATLALFLALTPFLWKPANQIFRHIRFPKAFQDSKYNPLPRLLDSADATGRLPFREHLQLLLISALIHALRILFILGGLSFAGVDIPWTAAFWLYPLLTIIHSFPMPFGSTGIREMSLVSLLGLAYGTPAAPVMCFSLSFIAVAMLNSSIGYLVITILEGRRKCLH